MSVIEIPQTMPAMVLRGHGNLDQLDYQKAWPVPDAGTQEVLIKVHACGLNNTDVNTRTGWYSKGVVESTTGSALGDSNEIDSTWGGAPLTFPRIQGADVCGTVVACGTQAGSALLGKRVMVDTWLRDWQNPQSMENCGYYGSEADGGFAAYTVVDHRQVHALQSPLSHAEVATFATAYITAENMLCRANVVAGDTVLITGASGGVGSALVQLAKRRGATTLAMASENKHAQMAAVNADHLLPRSPENLPEILKSMTGSAKVSVVADLVGGDYWATLIDCLARGGRYTCAGAIGGPMVEMDLRTFYLNDLTFTGATIVPAGLFANLVSYIERGEVAPLLAATYPLKELRRAQQAFIDKEHVGNIVVTLDD